MEARCENCKHCHTLYTPPTISSNAKYEYCCTLFLDENQVMYLGNDIYGMCECFIEKECTRKAKFEEEKYMITSGIIRRIDDLGRIAIPKMVRKLALGTENTEGKPMEISYEKDETIILKPYEPMED